MARVSSEVRELAREISAVKRGLRDATVTPQLGRSSLDDESINTYDSDGNLRARYGLQHDGTYTAAVLDGPVPPVPSVPTVSGGPGELSVTWDGTYVDDARAPMDFHVVEVWAADTDFSDRSEARLLGHFANESGGDITVARPVGEWHVALVSKAQSGRRSAVSARAVAVVESVVDQETIDELNEKLDGLRSVTWSTRAPTPTDGDGKPDHATWRQIDPDTDAIIGEWVWGSAAGEWVFVPIADDAIYSLDVGKLFASQLGVNTVVAEEIWAAKIAASKIDAEEINTQSLGADAGFIGVLNSAEIVGAVIKTAASGARVELDSGHGIRIFNTDGDLVLSADADGNLVTGVDQDSQVRIAPSGIELRTSRLPAIDEWATGGIAATVAATSSRVYVGTERYRTIEVYDPSGNKVAQWPTDGVSRSVAVSGSRIYVATSGARTIEVYDLAGVKQFEWSTDRNALDIAVSGTRAYVATGTRVVEIFDLNGNKQGEIIAETSTRSVAATSTRVYVGTDSIWAVEIFDTSGTKLGEFPTSLVPRSMSISGSRIYVVTGNIIEVYDLSGVKQKEFTSTNASSIATAGGHIYGATWGRRTVEVHNLAGVSTTASLDSETGLLTALSADLGGVTRTETLTPRNILPRGRTDNEDYAPTVEIVRPAFTHGLHVFEDTTHRDLELPDPPDGTQAWTGTGNSLKQWTRINGQWVETPTQPAPADHTHSRVETTSTRWVGIAGSNQLSSTTFAMAAQSGVSEPSTALSEFPLVVARRDGSNEVRLERLTGTIGRDYLGIASGDVTIVVPSGQTEASTTVTFPAGRFTAPPKVALASHSVASTLINYSVTAISTTSCTINVHRTSTAQTIVDWVAVQP